jgi:hypothetical protein
MSRGLHRLRQTAMRIMDARDLTTARTHGLLAQVANRKPACPARAVAGVYSAFIRINFSLDRFFAGVLYITLCCLSVRSPLPSAIGRGATLCRFTCNKTINFPHISHNNVFASLFAPKRNPFVSKGLPSNPETIVSESEAYAAESGAYAAKSGAYAARSGAYASGFGLRVSKLKGRGPKGVAFWLGVWRPG